MRDQPDPSTDGGNAAVPAADPAAIAAMIERHLPRLRAFVRLRMGPQLRANESASDLAQSACREVLQHLDRYRHQSEHGFRRWLFTTALRKIRDRVDYYRADKRDVDRRAEVVADGEFDGLDQLLAAVDTPSGAVDMQERIALFEAAFSRLPEEYREVITLARIVELPHAEIAMAMQRSEAASRMLLYRALAALAVELRRGG